MNASGTFATGVGLQAFALGDNSKLTINGNVRIYVNGPFAMSSNSCIEISEGRHPDVYELDAASRTAAMILRRSTSRCFKSSLYSWL